MSVSRRCSARSISRLAGPGRDDVGRERRGGVERPSGSASVMSVSAGTRGRDRCRRTRATVAASSDVVGGSVAVGSDGSAG